jgi:hypothetical protein
LLRAENPDAVQAEDVLSFLDLDPEKSMRLPEFRKIVHVSVEMGIYVCVWLLSKAINAVFQLYNS